MYCNAITSYGDYCINKSNGRLYCGKHKDYEKKKEIENIKKYIDTVFKTIDKNIKSRF